MKLYKYAAVLFDDLLHTDNGEYIVYPITELSVIFVKLLNIKH